MKSNRKTKTIILIILGGFFAFLPIFATNLNFKSSELSDSINFDNENLKVSKISGKIHIDNNWTEAKDTGICTGNGTCSNPYVIKDLVINGGDSGSCIFIENSDVYFRIENCTVYNSGGYPNAGIRLSYVNNSQLIDNNCSSNNRGIYLWDSHNNTISENTANDNTNDFGIFLDYSDNNTISGNTANYNMDGIYLMYSDNNTISENTANDNTYYGIVLSESNNNLVSGNILLGNDQCFIDYNGEGNIFENNQCGQDDKEHIIHGYNLFFLLGILSVVAILISKNVKKSKNLI